MIDNVSSNKNKNNVTINIGNLKTRKTNMVPKEVV